MDLARFPRRRYTPGPTPLHPLPRLSQALGGPEIWIKRDDLLGLAGGGNKTRKLEFLVADALAKGCDTLVTVGAVQLNHCRLTAAAAAVEGLKCRLVLEERVPGSYDPKATGNNLLFDLLGVEQATVVEAGVDLSAAMQAIADALEREGRRAYVIPGGGSNGLGALGYVACAQEILSQSFSLGVPFDEVICASGSAGTHAGLLAGFVGASADLPLLGVSVRRPAVEQQANVAALASEVAALAGLAPAPAARVVVDDRFVGPGYSLPTDEMVEAVRTTAALEAVLLDPVYTGKAMAGLIGLAGQGRWRRGQRVLFVHTGGSPALYAYRGVWSERVSMRVVGVLGGMGPAATLDLMAKVLSLAQGEREQDNVRLIVDCNPQVPDRNRAARGEGPSPGPTLAAMARGLQAAGADFLAMACNTAHAWRGEIEAAVQVPFVSMVDAACDSVAERFPGARRIGLIAAQGCLDAGVYQAAAAARGWTLLVPDEARQAAFMRALYRMKAGDFSEGVRVAVREAGEAVVAAGADVVLVACTEAPLVLASGDLARPMVDSTLALAERIVGLAREVD